MKKPRRQDDDMEIGRLPPEIAAKIIEAIEEKTDLVDNSMHAHYGVSEEEFDTWVREMFIEMVKRPLKTDVLDKFFKDLPGEVRCKIFAYYTAQHQYSHADLDIAKEGKKYRKRMS